MNDYLLFSNNSSVMYACQQESDSECDREVEMILCPESSPQSLLSGSSDHNDKSENNNCLLPGVNSERNPLELMKINVVELISPIINNQNQHSNIDPNKPNQEGREYSETSPPQNCNKTVDTASVDLSPVNYEQFFSLGGINSTCTEEYPICHSSLRERAFQESRNSLPHDPVDIKSEYPVSCSSTDDMASLIGQISLNDATKPDGAICP